MDYPTNLADEQWELVESLLVTEQHMGRPRTVNFRQIMNALLYKERTGCQWRVFPHDFLNRVPFGTILTYGLPMAPLFGCIRRYVNAFVYRTGVNLNQLLL